MDYNKYKAVEEEKEKMKNKGGYKLWSDINAMGSGGMSGKEIGKQASKVTDFYRKKAFNQPSIAQTVMTQANNNQLAQLASQPNMLRGGSMANMANQIQRSNMAQMAPAMFNEKQGWMKNYAESLGNQAGLKFGLGQLKVARKNPAMASRPQGIFGDGILGGSVVPGLV